MPDRDDIPTKERMREVAGRVEMVREAVNRLGIPEDDLPLIMAFTTGYYTAKLDRSQFTLASRIEVLTDALAAGAVMFSRGKTMADATDAAERLWGAA